MGIIVDCFAGGDRTNDSLDGGAGRTWTSCKQVFDRLYERNKKEWNFWMNECCVDNNGERYGWGRVLDYIGIPWRDPEHWYLNDGKQVIGQMSIFDFE